MNISSSSPPWRLLHRLNLLFIAPTTNSAYTGCVQESGFNLTGSMGTNNRIATSGYVYDAAGNMTTSPGAGTTVFNAENQLVSAGGQTYLYDGDGKRVEKASGSPLTANKLYWYGANSSPVIETDGSGAFQYRYISFNGMRVSREEANVWVDHYGLDALGNVRYVYGNNGTWDISDYYPFGGERAVSSSTSNRYKFTGKERDTESNLDNFGARFDSSTLARFMSPDPLGGHPEDPQTLNRYAYVRNNPVNLTDPTGLDFYLRCTQNKDNASTCQGGHVGTTDDKGNFTATVVTSDSIRGGQNSATVDQNGIEVTTGGKTYSGEYFDNAASHTTEANGNDVNHNPIDLKGSGSFGGFSFNINGNCNGTCLASGSFSFQGPRDFTGQVLELRGSFRSVVDRRIPGWGKSLDEWEFHPGTEQYRFGTGPSPHFSLPDNPKNTVPTVGPFHVDKDAPGAKHLGCALFGVGCN